MSEQDLESGPAQSSDHVVIDKGLSVGESGVPDLNARQTIGGTLLKLRTATPQKLFVLVRSVSCGRGTPVWERKQGRDHGANRALALSSQSDLLLRWGLSQIIALMRVYLTVSMV